MSAPAVTFLTWIHHFDWLVDEGFALDDLLYINRIAMRRADRINDYRGVTMDQLGFGSLASVIAVGAHVSAPDGSVPGPRQLVLPNPYDDGIDEDLDPSPGVLWLGHYARAA
jgi:hypothetical protein